MKIKTVLLLATATILLYSCAKSNYIGKTFPATSDVELFMDASEITDEYALMGHIVIDGDLFVSTEKLQEKMIEEAKNKGADAVFIEGLDEVYTSSTTTKTGSIKPDDKGGSNYNETTRTTQSKHLILKAKFFKKSKE